jgi:endoribonuclease Dicer
MPYAGYMQDLSQLIEDCLLPISDTDVALIDGSLQDSKASCTTDLTASTLEAMLLLDKAVTPENEADKAVDLFSAANESEGSEKDNSISTSTIDLSVLTLNNSPSTMTPPLVENSPLEQPDLAMATSVHEKLPLESITNLAISARLTPPSNSDIQPEQPQLFKMAVSAPAAQSPPPATALPSRNTDEVMAELKRPSLAAHISPPTKRRQTSFASEAKSESAISDLPQAELLSATKGHIRPEDEGPIEADAELESSDDEEEAQPTARPLKITERKRHHNAIADSYMQQRTQKQLKEGNKVRPEDEAQQSARWLVNQSENRQIISSPREYQVELFEKAKEKNIIAVLDTGLFHFSVSGSPADNFRLWQDSDCGAPSATHICPGIGRQSYWQAEASLILLS